MTHKSFNVFKKIIFNLNKRGRKEVEKNEKNNQRNVNNYEMLW